MSKTYHVTALGSAIVDVIAAVDDEFLLTHNIAKGVMTLIDEHRADQLYTAFGVAREIAGGSAANTMAGLASLGANGVFAGKIRQDRRGGAFVASMRDTGVHYTTEPAQRRAADRLLPDRGDGGRPAQHEHLSRRRARIRGRTISRKSEIADSGCALYRRLSLGCAVGEGGVAAGPSTSRRQNGTRVAFSLSDPFLMGRYRGEFLELLSKLDILFANEEEAKALFAVDTFDEALQALRPFPLIAALTRSELGCVVARGAEVHVVDAAPVDRVVDTTGAGDQFAAGFLYGLTHGQGLSDCGRLGALAAAEVISHYGARPEMPLRELAAGAGLI